MPSSTSASLPEAEASSVSYPSKTTLLSASTRISARCDGADACSSPDTTTARGKADAVTPEPAVRSLSGMLFCARRLSAVMFAGTDSSTSATSWAPGGENREESGSGSVLSRCAPGRPLDAVDRIVDPGVRFARSGRREEASDDASKYLSSSSPSVLTVGNDAERWGTWFAIRDDFAALVSGMGPERGVPSPPPPGRKRGVLLLRCEDPSVPGARRKKSDLRNASGLSTGSLKEGEACFC